MVDALTLTINSILIILLILAVVLLLLSILSSILNGTVECEKYPHSQDPKERLKPCSGRDELCNEVLNDDWASHPTWASEDSGFIAHRKNVHEEGLHKIEEERHDYDYNIEACGRTIQLLEPIAQQLRRMSDKDREGLEIPAGLGGQSETIHKRVIMKLYGREQGHKVIDNLHARPHAVIPILLNRLKQKQEEWKTAQREWEKVWREQTQKMFWKSLDHQGEQAGYTRNQDPILTFLQLSMASKPTSVNSRRRL